VRTSTATKAVVAAFAAALMALPRAAWAADSTEVEELRREVRQLQTQIQALRTAISEAAPTPHRQRDCQRVATQGPSRRSDIGSPARCAPRLVRPNTLDECDPAHTMIAQPVAFLAMVPV